MTETLERALHREWTAAEQPATADTAAAVLPVVRKHTAERCIIQRLMLTKPWPDNVKLVPRGPGAAEDERMLLPSHRRRRRRAWSRRITYSGHGACALNMVVCVDNLHTAFDRCTTSTSCKRIIAAWHYQTHQRRLKYTATNGKLETRTKEEFTQMNRLTSPDLPWFGLFKQYLSVHFNDLDNVSHLTVSVETLIDLLGILI